MIARLPATPSAPPMSAISSDSATTSPITWPLVKPSVFKTPISLRRSRTAMLIVLATTSRIVKVTAIPIPLSSSARLPAIAMKPAAKAFSVSVWVWSSRVLEQLVDRRRDLAGLVRVLDLDVVGARLQPAAGRLVQVLAVEQHHVRGRCPSTSRGRRRRSPAPRTRKGRRACGAPG